MLSRQAAEAAARELLADVELKAQMVPFEKPERRPEAVKETVGLCEMIAADYPNSAAASLALLRAGQTLVGSGRAKEAVPYFERALAMAHERQGVIALARRGLAEALEEAGDVRKAIAQYELLLGEPDSVGDARVYWDLGRCHEALGERQQAVDFYRRVVEHGGGSMWQELAKFRLTRLAEQESAAADDSHQTSSTTVGEKTPAEVQTP